MQNFLIFSIKKINKNFNFLYFLSFLIFTILVALDLYTYDSNHHISIAKWYKENWFSTTDLIHGYIDLSTYPPLAHQLLALLLYLLPTKIAYYFIILISWILTSLFSSLFFLEYLNVKNKTRWLPFLFFFSSLSLSVLKTIFLFGQYTTIFGFGLGFLSLYLLLKSLKEKKDIYFILFFLSFSLLTFSHHFSTLIFSLIIIFLFVLNFELFLENIKKLFLYGFLFSPLIIIGNYSFLESLIFKEIIPKTEIPHKSRMPQTNFDIELWITSYYGVSLFVLLFFPLIFLIFKFKNKKILDLYLIALFFFLLGLGRLTPLTKIFINLEHWITYDRFSAISGIIMSLFLGFLISFTISKTKPKKYLTFLLILLLFSYIIVNFMWLIKLYKLFYNYNPSLAEKLKIAERDLINFLNSLPNKNYRYQVFGYLNPIANIYSEVDLPTLETIYFTGRKLDWLINSGFAEINGITNKTFLIDFLTNKSIEYSIKYVITFYDKYYYKDFYINLLKELKWIPILNRSFGEDLYYVVWISPFEVKEVKFEQEKIELKHYLRGIVPLLTLAIFVVIYTLKRREFNL